MVALQRALGYTFRDPSLLCLALTHPSTQLPDNQRLEFLGDAVLESCVSDLLYHQYTDMNEGDLSSLRASLVCEDTLSVIARGLSIGAYLRMDHGADQTGGRQKPSILADALEAVLAAVYEDGGYEAARKLIFRLFSDVERLSSRRGQDDKGMLQEYTQAHGLAMPEYEIIAQQGPDHDRHYVARVSVMGVSLAIGEGSSKKHAEQAAARLALRSYAGEENVSKDGA